MATEEGESMAVVVRGLIRKEAEARGLFENEYGSDAGKDRSRVDG